MAEKNTFEHDEKGYYYPHLIFKNGGSFLLRMYLVANKRNFKPATEEDLDRTLVLDNAHDDDTVQIRPEFTLTPTIGLMQKPITNESAVDLILSEYEVVIPDDTETYPSLRKKQ